MVQPVSIAAGWLVAQLRSDAEAGFRAVLKDLVFGSNYERAVVKATEEALRASVSEWLGDLATDVHLERTFAVFEGYFRDLEISPSPDGTVLERIRAALLDGMMRTTEPVEGLGTQFAPTSTYEALVNELAPSGRLPKLELSVLAAIFGRRWIQRIQEDAIEDDALAGLSRQLNFDSLAEHFRDHAALILASSPSFVGGDLRGRYLAGIRLPQRDFSFADLSGANLTGAKLDHATLGGAVCRNTVFDQAELWKADFREPAPRAPQLDRTLLQNVFISVAAGGPLAGAAFRHAGLNVARFDGLILTDVDFGHADLEAAYFVDCTFRGRTTLEGALVNGTKLAGATFELDDLDLAFRNTRFQNLDADSLDALPASIRAQVQGA